MSLIAFGPRVAGSVAMRRTTARVGAVLLTALVVAACASTTVTPTPKPKPTTTGNPSAQPTPSPSQLSTASPSGAPGDFALAMGAAQLLAPADDNGALAGREINDFGFDLLRRLDSKGNLCASPTSIALALAMVRPGARGGTATEIDAVLRSLGSTGSAGEIVALLASLEQRPIYEQSGEISDTPFYAGQEPLVELDVSNQVFSQPGMTLEQAYLDALSSTFGAGVGLLDFAKDPEAARLVINRWASEETHGRIPSVLQPGDVNEFTRIALADAIYLRAGWQYPFDPKKTESLAFTRGDGSKVSVPTMALDQLLHYTAGKGYRAVELPYEDSSLSMLIVLPDDMASFVSGLTAAKLATIVNAETAYDVGLTMPRFSAESRFDLGAVLAAMGMPTLFDSFRADLSGITHDQKLYAQHVIHQANIDVVEQGSTAAAVTVVLVGGMGGGPTPTPPPHVKFHVDKPFLYFIRDAASGVVLFMGRIDDPSATN